jgi:hypothetical protein
MEKCFIDWQNIWLQFSYKLVDKVLIATEFEGSQMCNIWLPSDCRSRG